MGFKVTSLKCTKDVYFPDIDLLGNAIMSLVWKEGCYIGEIILHLYYIHWCKFHLQVK